MKSNSKNLKQSKTTKPNKWLAPIVGISVAAIISIVLNLPLLSTYVKLWITPSSVLTSNIIPDQTGPVRSNPSLVIPKINVDAPTIYGINSTAEPDIQLALERGVLHYAGTPLPGQIGNSVFVGHSSNNVFNKGDYKFVFALLEKLEIGDKLYFYNNGVKYIYNVSVKKVVAPTDVSVLAQSTTPMVTLITCTPVGTNWNRLIIAADQISPDPKLAKPVPAQNTGGGPVLPGN